MLHRKCIVTSKTPSLSSSVSALSPVPSVSKSEASVESKGNTSLVSNTPSLSSLYLHYPLCHHYQSQRLSRVKRKHITVSKNHHYHHPYLRYHQYHHIKVRGPSRIKRKHITGIGKHLVIIIIRICVITSTIISKLRTLSRIKRKHITGI